jgi:hypothetical protein
MKEMQREQATTSNQQTELLELLAKLPDKLQVPKSNPVNKKKHFYKFSLLYFSPIS